MLKVSFVGYCRLRFKFQTGVSRVSIARRVSNLRRGRLNFETWVQIAFFAMWSCGNIFYTSFGAGYMCATLSLAPMPL